MNDREPLLETKDSLNSVSPSFCLAKWKQVTIHLQNGQTHSCHHPPVHPVPVSELERNPSALHNTAFKKQERKEMLAGQRPSGCKYCWNIEDAPGEHFSDRVLKSVEPWARPHLEEIAKTPWDADVLPSYLEVSFSHACNFKCAYCSPHVSSKWLQEILRLGPYPTDQAYNSLEALKQSGRMPIPEDQPNPYREAFWKWWPELYPHLQVMRITGGEPLLVPDTFKVLDYVHSHPRPDLDLSVNSNLGVPEDRIQTLLEKTTSLFREKKIKSFMLFTSLDTWGEQAEYIRDGLDFNLFERNLRTALAQARNFPEFRVVIMCTFNALSVPRFRHFLEWVLELKKTYVPPGGWPHLFLDIAYLRYPSHLSAQILPGEMLEKIADDVRFMVENRFQEGPSGSLGFYDLERRKLESLVEWARSPVEPSLLAGWRKDFGLFIGEYDRRRKKNFVRTFPELGNFLHLI